MDFYQEHSLLSPGVLGELLRYLFLISLSTWNMMNRLGDLKNRSSGPTRFIKTCLKPSPILARMIKLRGIPSTAIKIINN